MKRIKYEEIQHSIQNYVKQRNLNPTQLPRHLHQDPTTKPSKTSSSSINSSSSSSHSVSKKHSLLASNASALPKPHMDSVEPSAQSLAEVSLAALNDLVLIESSISDYYAYTFNSPSDQDYLSQFQIIEHFIETQRPNDELDQLLYPLFVYLCIDLTFIGTSIQPLIDSRTPELIGQPLAKSLLVFNETKDLARCPLVNKWMQSKYQVRVSSLNWHKFLRFLRASNTHLFLRTINVHLQITINDYVGPEADEPLDLLVCKAESGRSEPSNLKLEQKDREHTENKGKAEQSVDTGGSHMSLKSLEECIDSIKSQPSQINGACCYYLNDQQDCITSASMSPNTSLLSFTSENSSLLLYRLHDDSGVGVDIGRDSKQAGARGQAGSYEELVGGHSNVVFKSKFTHDSKYLLSCGADNVACLWDVNKPKASHVVSYSGHLYPVWDLETFSRLNLFATASKDGTSRLWSFDHIYPLRIYCGHQSDVNCVRFHPNGAYLATGSSDKTTRLWSVQTGEFVRLFSGHRSRVFSVAFSPDGNYLASAGEDKKIKLWDLRSGGLFREFKGHTDIVHSLSFDNNSEILCSGSLDRTVKFWDVHRKNIKIGPDLSSECSVSAKSFSSSSRNSSSPSNHSSELVKSTNVDFNVYSIYCDYQNVFYLSGARKPPKSSDSSALSGLADLKLSCSTSRANDTLTSNRKQQPNLKHQQSQQPKQQQHQRSSSRSDKRASLGQTSQPGHQSKVRSSGSSSSGISTRRRAAQAAGVTTKSAQSATTAIAASAANANSFNANSNNNSNSSYLFSNNDDLYEI